MSWKWIVSIIFILILIWLVVSAFRKSRKADAWDSFFIFEAIGEILSAIISSLF